MMKFYGIALLHEPDLRPQILNDPTSGKHAAQYSLRET
jgi:hypothetical protein